jgi:Lrp/AsnC family transcriptional regulator, leucine-responsive regulatory protein
MANLDAIDLQLLTLLQANDQSSLGELGKAVGLAPSSVKERIKRLSKQGVINGFHAKVSPEALRLELLAFIFVGWTNPATEARFLARINQEPVVLECHHVTGSWNYIVKVRLRNTQMLEAFLTHVIKSVAGIERTETLIVLSSPKEIAELPTEVPKWARPQ